MRHSNLIFTLFLFIFSCKKQDKYIHNPIKTNILVQEELAATNIYNLEKPSQKFSVIDTLVEGSEFNIYKDVRGIYYNNGIRLFFKAGVDSTFLTESSWKIGDDLKTWNGNNIYVDFPRPVGSIQVRLITTYKTKTEALLVKTDTVYKTIKIESTEGIFGEYEGANIDEPAKKFKIRIGYVQENDPRIGGKSFIGIENLPQNFPIKSEITPTSTGFGITGETVLQGYFNYNGATVGSPYAIGFLNENKDSIKIRYNYGIITDLSNTYNWSSIVSKEFIGKKL